MNLTETLRDITEDTCETKFQISLMSQLEFFILQQQWSYFQILQFFCGDFKRNNFKNFQLTFFQIHSQGLSLPGKKRLKKRLTFNSYFESLIFLYESQKVSTHAKFQVSLMSQLELFNYFVARIELFSIICSFCADFKRNNLKDFLELIPRGSLYQEKKRPSE